MIPVDWIEHRRDDREVVGYIRQDGDDFVAADRFGRDLTDPTDWFTAEQTLDEHGLAWLMEPMLLAREGAEPLRVRIVEVTASVVRVKPDDFGDMSSSTVEAIEVTLPVADGVLTTAPPITEWPAR